MTQTVLDQLGGEDTLRQLVNRFYDLIETQPEAHDLLRLHFRGHGMEHTRDEQTDFLNGFLGGRQYYKEKHGHMDVREIHAHIPIRTADAEQWLATMDQALDDCGHTGAHIDKIRATLRRVALMLVNEVDDWRVTKP
jgi:hemoglobin